MNGTSIKNPIISFTSDDLENHKELYMRANSLSQTERLALQQGAVMEVFVSKIDGDKVEVKLSSNTPTQARTVIETLDDFDYQSISDYDEPSPQSLSSSSYSSTSSVHYY